MSIPYSYCAHCHHLLLTMEGNYSHTSDRLDRGWCAIQVIPNPVQTPTPIPALFPKQLSKYLDKNSILFVLSIFDRINLLKIKLRCFGIPAKLIYSLPTQEIDIHTSATHCLRQANANSASHPPSTIHCLDSLSTVNCQLFNLRR